MDCVICTADMDVAAILGCGHRLCFICALRPAPDAHFLCARDNEIRCVLVFAIILVLRFRSLPPPSIEHPRSVGLEVLSDVSSISRTLTINELLKQVFLWIKHTHKWSLLVPKKIAFARN